MNAYETFEVGDLTVKVVHDDDPIDSPRDWENVTEMVCWHRRYDLGDRQPDSDEQEALERGGIRLLERYLRLTRGVIAFRTLGLYDHSGISMYLDGGPHWSDSAGWDSGTVGFIYVTREIAEREGPHCDGPNDLAAWAEQAIRSDVEIYDQYLTGDIWGYIVEDADGEHLDSCWGYYGTDEAEKEGKSQAEWLVKARAENAAQEAREREFWANHDLTTEATR